MVYHCTCHYKKREPRQCMYGELKCLHNETGSSSTCGVVVLASARVCGAWCLVVGASLSLCVSHSLSTPNLPFPPTFCSRGSSRPSPMAHEYTHKAIYRPPRGHRAAFFFFFYFIVFCFVVCCYWLLLLYVVYNIYIIYK